MDDFAYKKLTQLTTIHSNEMEFIQCLNLLDVDIYFTILVLKHNYKTIRINMEYYNNITMVLGYILHPLILHNIKSYNMLSCCI
jgi:hypothetical protein